MRGTGSTKHVERPECILTTALMNTTIIMTPAVAAVMKTSLTAVGSIIWALLCFSSVFRRRWNTF